VEGLVVARYKFKDSSFEGDLKTGPGSAANPWMHHLLAEWTDWQRHARRSPQTVRNRAPVVQRFAQEVGCDPVSACPADIMEWFSRHPEWAQATAHNYSTALSAWFKWLIRFEHRADNPMLKLEQPAKPPCTPRPVSSDGLTRMFEHRKGRQLKTKAMVMLGSLAGLRNSEIARVKGEDIDLSGRLIYVLGKGGATKTVPLHPMLVELATHMPATGYWFPGKGKNKGSHVNPNSVGCTITRVMKGSGVRATPHQLRHWFGTNALRASGDLRAVQSLMRHSSITSTQVYTEIADETRADVVDMLDPFMETRRRFLESKGESDL